MSPASSSEGHAARHEMPQHCLMTMCKKMIVGSETESLQLVSLAPSLQRAKQSLVNLLSSEQKTFNLRPQMAIRWTSVHVFQ